MANEARREAEYAAERQRAATEKRAIGIPLPFIVKFSDAHMLRLVFTLDAPTPPDSAARRGGWDDW